MKRELAFALEAQSQLNCGSLGRTRSSKPQFSQFSSGKDKPEVVNGGKDGVGTSQCNGRLHVYERNKRFKTAKSEGKSVNDVVEASGDLAAVAATPEVAKIDVAREATRRRFTRSALKPTMVAEGDSKLDNDVDLGARPTPEDQLKMRMCVDEGPKIDVTMEATPRRFTRAALKPAVVEGDLKLDDDGDLVGSENGSVLGTPTKKLELKMSKKIELTERITTVRELFETGLLEGHPVFYNVGKEGNKLRGVIKGVGILCSCSLCKGSRVILPSQFEIHACKSYRRASQYICLENGKSLLQLLEICKKSALDTLEVTIQTVIGHLPVKKLSRTSEGGLVSKPSASPTLPVILRKNGEQKRKRNSLGPAWAPTSPRSASQYNLPQEKRQRKMTKKSSRSDLIPKSPGSASVRSLSQSKRKISKGLSKSASVTRSSETATVCTSSQKKTKWKITKKDQNMHRLVFEEGGLPDGTEVGYYSRGKKLLDGYKKGLGIFCFCCDSEVSASQFEAHAGWASRKKPYGYIYTSNGVSLHEYAISLLKHRECATKDNDDLCIICRDGGDLLLCDGCPRAFHKECASLPIVPHGKWYCKYCENMFHREKFVERNANAIAAGRVSGVDPIDEITKRCIRIVKNPENTAAVSCLLCRGYEFSKTDFGPTTVILCDQCEKEYHVGCLKKNKMANLKRLPKGKWYCSIDCKKMRSVLKNLVKREPQMLPDTLMDLTRKKQMESGLDGVTDFDVKWRLLNGNIVSRETKSLLSEVVGIFHECFDPIIDAQSGKDFIPSMVYGDGDIRGQDFGGMYSVVLTVNSAVVSAGILRIFGQDMAELPLVATSKCNQGKGYFQILFSCIEKLLISLNVKRIVLPSADEAEAIWINKFGFAKLSPQQLANYRKTCSAMMIFKGTSMLEKEIPECQAVKPDATSSDLSVE